MTALINGALHGNYGFFNECGGAVPPPRPIPELPRNGGVPAKPEPPPRRDSFKPTLEASAP